MDNQEIKNNLQARRISMKLTQEKMADALGISRQAYINLERGKTALINKQVLRIAQCLNLSPEEVILGYNPQENSENYLREKDHYEELIKALRVEYEERISSLEEKLDTMGQVILSQRHNIQTLEEMKDLLLRRLSEKND